MVYSNNISVMNLNIFTNNKFKKVSRFQINYLYVLTMVKCWHRET